MKKLLLGSVLSAGIKVASAGLTFLMFLFLARVLGPDEYGQFATMFSLGSIIAVIALFGQHTLGLKTLSGLEDVTGAHVLRSRVVARNYMIVGAASCIGIGGLLMAPQVVAWFGGGIGHEVMLGAAIFVIPFALSELVAHQQRAFGDIGWALVPRDVIWRLCVVLLCMTGFVAQSFLTDALSAMILVAGVLCVLALAQIAVFVQRNRSRFSGAGSAGADLESPPQISIWIWVASLAMMGANLNIVASAPFLTEAETGAYFAAQKTSQLLQLPILAINIVGSPLFARLHVQKDVAQLQDVARKLAIILTLPLLLGAVILVLLAPWLLSLFDAAYVIAAQALIVLAGSFLIVGLGGPARQMMLMADGERALVRLTLVAELAGLALVLALVPVFGITGAACAVLVSRIILTVVTVRWCQAHLGVDTSILSIWSARGTVR